MLIKVGFEESYLLNLCKYDFPITFSLVENGHLFSNCGVGEGY